MESFLLTGREDQGPLLLCPSPDPSVWDEPWAVPGGTHFPGIQLCVCVVKGG